MLPGSRFGASGIYSLMKMTGIIFDIKEFALNDGDGIRTTVFLKGCPLRCIWCHNPEGLSPQRELYIKQNGCLDCGLCKTECGHEECKGLGRCVRVCPRDLVSISGTEIDSQELADRLLRHEEFFRSVGGGITLSGGEPLMQADFCIELLKRLKGRVHRAIETSGFSSESVFKSAVSECDLVIMDIKLASEKSHIEYTGVSNKPILKNAEYLKRSGIPHLFRVPLIPGITDTEENLSGISEIVGGDRTELLPYNKLAGAKYAGVGRVFTDKIKENNLSRNDLEALTQLFENATVKK